MITLSGIQVFDLFFRFSSIGILICTLILVVRRAKGINSNITYPLIGFLICIIGYILLTLPIDNEHFGGIRHVLLLLTDVTPFVILWLALSLLNPKFSLLNTNILLLVPIVTYLLWLVYFFLVIGGYGIMHDVNHAIGIVTFIVVIYLCLNEYFDDLNNQRRNNRLLLVVMCVCYMIALVVFEFVLKDFRNSWQFSFGNSLINFVLVGMYLLKIVKEFQFVPFDSAKPVKDESACVQKLNEWMANGGFLQSNLTIGELAKQLSLPSHQLRVVINQELGFSNFSHYLNSYRIPYICKQLKDPNKKQIPVLTLALECGYGSIAPFNRAFKQLKGVTPTQYRNQF